MNNRIEQYLSANNTSFAAADVREYRYNLDLDSENRFKTCEVCVQVRPSMLRGTFSYPVRIHHDERKGIAKALAKINASFKDGGAFILDDEGFIFYRNFAIISDDPAAALQSLESDGYSALNVYESEVLNAIRTETEKGRKEFHHTEPEPVSRSKNTGNLSTIFSLLGL